MKTAEQIELVFGTKASTVLSYCVFEANSSISKIRVLTMELCPKLWT